MSPPFDISILYDGIADADRFDRAVERFDASNREDPRMIEHENGSYPAEFLLAQALCHRVIQLAPHASEALLLASRCQHLRRWEHPRHTYPDGREGYLSWRADLKTFHADQAAEIIRDSGYDSATLAKVRTLNLKENLKTNPDCQTLEDGLCLVFLQFQFNDIVEMYPEPKVVGILKKTAAKMSPAGLKAATKLVYSEAEQALLGKALSRGAPGPHRPPHTPIG